MNPRLRQRLERFLLEHGDENCNDDVCIVHEAQKLVTSVCSSHDPEHEMLLVSVALLLHQEEKKQARLEIEKYQAAIAAFVARNGGVLKLELDEIEALDGTVTSFVDPDGAAITYRFVQQGGLRS